MDDLGQIIGQNIKGFRTHFGYTQEHLANYLGVDRSLVSYYESAEREISLVHLNKLADLFGVELEDLLERDPEKVKAALSIAFRSEGLEQTDLESIATFQRVVKNYLQMKEIANEQK